MIFSHGSFSEFAFSAAEFTEIDDSAFIAFLADVTAPREWLLEIDALSLAESSEFTAAFSGAPFGVLAFSSNAGALEGGAVTLHFSTSGYISTVLEEIGLLDLPGSADDGYPASLDIDLTAETLDPRFGAGVLSVARAGAAATRFNAAGELEAVAADTPRFDYDPVTLEPAGLTVEPARTNSVRNNTMQGAVAGSPGTMPTHWSATSGGGVTREIVGVGQENGIDYIDIRFQAAAAISAFVVWDTNIAAAVGQIWASSFYVRLVAGSLANISLGHNVSEYSVVPAFLTGSGAFFTPTSSPLASQRSVQTRTITDAAVATVRPSINLTATGAYDVTLRIGLPQAESTSAAYEIATSPIRTGGAAAGRNADVVSMLNISPWYRADQGTIYLEYDNRGTSFPWTFAISDGAGTNDIIGYVNTSASNRAAARWRSGGVVQAEIAGLNAVTAGNVVRQAIAWQVNDFASAHDGGSVVTDAAGTVPAVDRLYLGANFAGTGSYIAGHIRRFTFFPKRLSNATLQGISTAGPTLRALSVPAGDPDSATWYPGNLTSEITIERSVLSGAMMSGLSRVFGEVKLANPGGELDNLVRDYALDGRPARLYIGRPTDRRADFGLVFSGVIARTPEGNLNEISIALSDGVSKLEQSIQATVYAGTGGLEGGADLAGKPKPLAFGEVLNVAPPLVDSTKLIYQAHDGPVQDIPDVYDRGVALTRGADYSSQSDLETTAPAAGTFRVWPAGGYFRLGAAPDGTVTCNVEGDASGAGYVDTHADILLRILVDYAALFSTEIEPGSFSRLNTAAPGACGIWIGTDVRQISAVVDEILISAGAFGGFSRLGVFTVGQVDTPGGIVHGEITAEEISELERLPLPADLEPVIWRSSLGYQRNFTVQSDLAASVPAARVAFAAQEYRVVSQSDETIKSRRLLARDLVAPSLYVNQADADTENARRFALWSSPRTPYRAAARPTSLPRELGQDVVMTHSRYGLAAGRFGRVIGHRVSAINTEVELTVLI
jgi:hypothetical protein